MDILTKHSKGNKGAILKQIVLTTYHIKTQYRIDQHEENYVRIC